MVRIQSKARKKLENRPTLKNNDINNHGHRKLLTEQGQEYIENYWRCNLLYNAW